MMVPESRKQQRAAFIALAEWMHCGGWRWLEKEIDLNFYDSFFCFFSSSFHSWCWARPSGV